MTHSFKNKELTFKFINSKKKVIIICKNQKNSNPKKIHFLKYLENNPSSYNFYSICAFNSLDDILYLIYARNNSIIYYNLIDNKIINIIKKAHNQNIEGFRHFQDEINQRDLIISISGLNFENNIKLWNIINFECLFNLDFSKCEKISACFLNDINQIYIVIGIIKETLDNHIKIYNFNGDKIKEINNTKSNVYYIDNYYDNKLLKNYIITCNNDSVISYDYNINKLYHRYNDEKDYNQEKCGIIINNREQIIEIIILDKNGIIRIWDFHSGKLLQKINTCLKYVYKSIGICLWDSEFMFVAWGDKSIRLLKINDLKNIKTLVGHKKDIVNIQIIKNTKYGNFLISQDYDSKLKLWGDNKKYIVK